MRAREIPCPDCGELAPALASRRVRCAGCGIRFDLVAPAERGEPGGPFRDLDRVEARSTPPPPSEVIEDLSGGVRIRYVRLFALRRGPGLLPRLLGLFVLALVAGALSAFGEFAWAAADRRATSPTAIALWFAIPFAAVGLAFAWIVWPRGPREVWIERGSLFWSGGKSRALAEIEGVCLEPRDITRGGTTGQTVTTTWSLAFPLPSGAAERFLDLGGLPEEGRTWLVRHLNDGIALAKADAT